MVHISDEAYQLASNARQSIGAYCSSECNAYCCRKGYLALTLKETELVTGAQRESLEREGALTGTKDAMFALDLDARGGCPSLMDFKCIIHGDANRPQACKDFPIFLWSHDVVRVSQRCPAAKENLLYPYLAQLKLLGFKISYGSELF